MEKYNNNHGFMGISRMGITDLARIEGFHGFEILEESRISM
jgi:hypothetical protein